MLMKLRRLRQDLDHLNSWVLLLVTTATNVTGLVVHLWGLHGFTWHTYFGYALIVAVVIHLTSICDISSHTAAFGCAVDFVPFTADPERSEPCIAQHQPGSPPPPGPARCPGAEWSAWRSAVPAAV
jgi:hypothetical protein